MIFTAQEWSSTYLTDIELVIDRRILGMLGLRHAELYFTMKIRPPRRAPWGVLPGNNLGVDVDLPYVMVIDRPER